MFPFISERLREWYDPSKRDLPWKSETDPYRIWLSEVILQQTRVEQGRPYYLKFVRKYPHVEDLAGAGEDEVLSLWEGLGYYSRARNLHAAARQVIMEFGGKFPSTYEDLLKLKGVGTYTAAAVASFAFGERKAVVDGNVFRFLSRITGDPTPIDTTEGKKRFTALAEAIIPSGSPGEHNQAIMDFGALVCKPANPMCNDCPFVSDCVAYREGRQDKLPVKSSRTSRRQRYFCYLVIRRGEELMVGKRGSKDIWGGLYELPCLEMREGLGEREIKEALRSLGLPMGSILSVSELFSQQLSHQNISARFVELGEVLQSYIPGSYSYCNLKALQDKGFPKIIRNYLNRELNSIT